MVDPGGWWDSSYIVGPSNPLLDLCCVWGVDAVICGDMIANRQKVVSPAEQQETMMGFAFGFTTPPDDMDVIHDVSNAICQRFVYLCKCGIIHFCIQFLVTMRTPLSTTDLYSSPHDVGISLNHPSSILKDVHTEGLSVDVHPHLVMGYIHHGLTTFNPG